MNKMESDERYRRAKRRVSVLKGFYIHLATYIAVMAMLLLIDFLTGGGWWFYWPLLGWGIGIVAHAFTVFGSGAFSVQIGRRKRLEI
jgi:fatty acid desaturase